MHINKYSVASIDRYFFRTGVCGVLLNAHTVSLHLFAFSSLALNAAVLQGYKT